MTTNFIDAADKYVAAKIVYGKAADSKLYLEAAYTNQAPQADVEEAFLKNQLIVKVGDVFYKPFKLDGNKVTVGGLVSTTVTLTEFQAKASA
ncbi:MAG: hypothetical protein J6U54_23095 [Clostridiales bacterium]|nr:hypothetical protein [Clostridiales bacterium]